MKNLTSLTYILILSGSLFSCQPTELTNGKIFTFAKNVERIWIGPDFWANRLQDWKLENGRIICTAANENRNLYLLTYQVDTIPGSLSISTDLGFLNRGLSNQGWIGIRVGIKGKFKDYRDNAVFGTGINIGITTGDTLFYETGSEKQEFPFGKLEGTFTLSLEKVTPEGSINILLKEKGSGTKLVEATIENGTDFNLTGGIALVSSFQNNERYNTIESAWFDYLTLEGSSVAHLPEQAFGPVLFTQHTLSNGTLKMTSQLPPIGEADSQTGTFEILDEASGVWKEEDLAQMDPDSRIIRFRIDNWNSTKDIDYHIKYNYLGYDGTETESFYEGTIRKTPTEKEEFVVAAFTGNNDLGFPNNDLIDNVKKQDPDFLFFSGDQIYEGVGGYGVQRKPVDMAILDYLRKWYMFGWTYRDLMRNVPSVSIPDDHDVFHGNIWGAEGKATPSNFSGTEAQDQGGYKMGPKFVNMVERTQTSHLPDPFDPTPVLQDIGVYYTSLNYGGISFAIVEDRKFKSAPTILLPDAQVWNGWPQNLKYDVKANSDHPDAKLLGERQLKFLNEWAIDWSGGTWMKVLLSQTIFANVATLPEDEIHDQNVPRLRILASDEYADGDKIVTDMDSNGWPRTGRNKALTAIRRGFALHIAGDQHLGSTIQYGIEEFRDASYAICVPSVSNVWPRRWYPPNEGANPIPGNPPYTGDYEDGFGNKITVHAVSNPSYTGREPGNLYDRATGYGIVRFNKSNRKIVLENWPRDINPADPGAEPYPGWPVILEQEDNYGREPLGHLPLIEISGMENPVLQVIHENTGEIIYAIRINGTTFTPKVFDDGLYTIRIGDPHGEMKDIKNLKINGDGAPIQVAF